MSGKGKCNILKAIRRKIAEKNNIAYAPSECNYQGECSGTCPKCESEVRYLESELAKQKNLGKSVAVAGVAAALVVGATGCDANIPDQTAGVPMEYNPSAWQSEDSNLDSALDNWGPMGAIAEDSDFDISIMDL